MKNNTVPLDVYYLTMVDIKEGLPLDGQSCPVAHMLNDYPEIEYTDVVVEKSNIEYVTHHSYFSKPTSWTLHALIHYIDEKDIIIVRDVKENTEFTLFGPDIGLHPPYRIEEYEDWFNLHLDEYPQAHLDEHVNEIQLPKSDDDPFTMYIDVTLHTDPSPEEFSRSIKEYEQEHGIQHQLHRRRRDNSLKRRI